MYGANRIGSSAHNLLSGSRGIVTEENHTFPRIVALAHLLGRVHQVLDAQTLVFAEELVLLFNRLWHGEELPETAIHTFGDITCIFQMLRLVFTNPHVTCVI